MPQDSLGFCFSVDTNLDLPDPVKEGIEVDKRNDLL